MALSGLPLIAGALDEQASCLLRSYGVAGFDFSAAPQAQQGACSLAVGSAIACHAHIHSSSAAASAHHLSTCSSQ